MFLKHFTDKIFAALYIDRILLELSCHCNIFKCHKKEFEFFKSLTLRFAEWRFSEVITTTLFYPILSMTYNSSFWLYFLFATETAVSFNMYILKFSNYSWISKSKNWMKNFKLCKMSRIKKDIKLWKEKIKLDFSLVYIFLFI